MKKDKWCRFIQSSKNFHQYKYTDGKPAEVMGNNIQVNFYTTATKPNSINTTTTTQFFPLQSFMIC